MKRFLLQAVFLFAGIVGAVAQEAKRETETDNWYFGVGGGLHTTWMHVTNLDKHAYPSHKNGNSGLFSLWVRRTFGDKNQYAIRPEVNFLSRGGTLNEINNVSNYYKTNDIKDIFYRVTSRYTDIRIPLMYRFCEKTSLFRPYAYVAPVLGFCHGGYVQLEEQLYPFSNSKNSYAYTGTRIKASKANTAAFYFAAAIGGGVDWQVSVAGRQCLVGFEAMYELDITDTYGHDNKANNKIVLSNKNNGQQEGNRKYHGLELRLNVGVPFDIFKKRPRQKAEHIVDTVYIYVEKEVQPQKEAVIEDKPCYSLDEINDMMNQGISVEGKTICAIDDAINFDTNKSNIKPESYAYLDRLAMTLKRTNARIMVKGHTDNVGSEEYNLNLSKERAQSVVNYLVKKGVPRARLAYDFYGMSRPLTTNDTEEGRRTNRRVEFEILK